MINAQRIQAMRQIQVNLENEGQLSRSECVDEMLENLGKARLLLLECHNVLDSIYKCAEAGNRNDEILLYSGVLGAKLAKELEIE